MPNRASDSQPRIVIDARPLSQGRAGGFRAYVRALTLGLRERIEAGEAAETILWYVDRPLSPEDAALLPPDAPVRSVGTDRIRADLFRFRAQLRQDKPDLVVGTTNYLPFLPDRLPAVLAIHDALGVTSPPWEANTPRTLRERLIHAYWKWRTVASARRARHLITGAESARTDLMSALRLPSERFTVIANGIVLPPGVSQNDEPLPEPSGVLVLESPDPRKNVGIVFRALAGTRVTLHLVCTTDGVTERVREALRTYPNLSVRTYARPSDRELSKLYHQVGLLAWPSRREGFGLPPLEAMARGSVVVSSTAPAMPEVLGDVPRYAAPDLWEDWRHELLDLLARPDECRERSQAGKRHAAQFTCRRMADATVRVWREALQ